MQKAGPITVVFAVILMLAALLRFLHLEAIPPGLYADEAMNGSNALWALQSHQFKVFYPENHGREGLFPNIVALAIYIFGNELRAIRIPSALFGVGTVAGIFFLARELFRGQTSRRVFGFSWEDSVALAASFFLAVSYWHLNFSRIGFRAITAPFFLVWAFALLFVALRRSNLAVSAVAGLFFGLGFYSYIPYRIAPALLIFPWMLANRQRRLQIFAVFLVTAFAAALPLVLYFLEYPSHFFSRIRQISILSSASPLTDFFSNLAKTFGMLWFRGDPNPRHNLPEAAELWWPVGIFCAIGLLIALISIIRTQQRLVYALLCTWFLLFSLPAALSYEPIPNAFPHALRSMLMLPAAMLAAAIGFCFLLQQLSLRKFSSISLGILVILFFCFHVAATVNQYFVRWASRPDTFSAFDSQCTHMGRWLRTLPNKIPKYVIVNTGGLPVPLPDNPAILFPMPLQPIMFLTDTWPGENQRAKNLTYLFEDQILQISCNPSCIVLTLKPDTALNSAVKQSLPDLSSSTQSGFTYFYKGIP